MTVPYTFGSATAPIPLSQLDSNFASAITLGNTSIQLGNTVTTLNNMTLANVTITSVSAAITPSQGGTGLTTLTANNVLLGNGTSNVAFVAPGTSGNVLTSNGTTWLSTAPASASTSISNGTSNVSVVSSNGNITAFTAGTQALNIDTSQNLAFNSGYGSVSTVYGCRAYASFNGVSGVSINGSKGVTSITRSGTGLYTVSLSFTMPDTAYAIVMGGGKLTAAADYSGNTSNMSPYSITTTGFNIVVNCPTQGVSQDSAYISFALFR